MVNNNQLPATICYSIALKFLVIEIICKHLLAFKKHYIDYTVST